MNRRKLIRIVANLCAGGLLALGLSARSAVPTVVISSTPLTVAIPSHPQVLIAIGNSQSMDGDLSGAIYTGSGATGYSELAASSSPTSYTVPTGFTAPVNGAAAGSSTAYTVNQYGTLYDNSASRLNVAKAAVSSVLSTYISGADFALMDYSTGSSPVYQTWVYYMSTTTSGFTFTNSNTAPPSGELVANPCYGINVYGGTNVDTDCYYLSKYYFNNNATSLSGYKYMLLGASSDDNNIVDVLYATPANNLPPLFNNYNGPNPASPFPPYFYLSNYEAGSIFLSYNSSTPSIGPFGTSPTNAGYVPYSKEVFYALRGFGYDSNPSPTTGNLVVSMQSSGASPTTASVNAALAPFSAPLAPETSSSGTSEIKASAVQSPLAGLMSQAKTYLNSVTSTTSTCSTTKYVILMTDGLPTLDLSGNSWPPLGSAAATGYGVTATFSAVDGSLVSTNDQALTDTISKITALNTAGIKTYVVGLGAGADPTINPTAAATLNAMAVAGGTVSAIAATTPAAVTASLQTILSQILAATETTTSAAANTGNILTTNTFTYKPQFTSSDALGDFTGDLLAYSINSNTGFQSTTATWSAQSSLDNESYLHTAPNGRNIITWNPTSGVGIPFEWTNISSAGLGTALTTNPSDTSGQDVLNYIRGSATKYTTNGGKFRPRTHLLGDIVDSQPAYVGAPSSYNYSSSYSAFQSTYANRTPMIYVGANDGMLHAFNASVGTAATGNEVFAFIPNGVYNNLTALTYPTYNQNHQFYVDASPQSTDVQFSDGTWHTLLQGGENDGGKTIYTLDITNPANFTEAKASSLVLWEFADTNLGYTYSAPTTTLTTAGTYYTFFGNGYNSTSGQPYLYAVNPQTGALVASINLCSKVPGACSSSYANGLSTVEAMNTSGVPSAGANVIYAGDLQGNLWRVNISNAIPSSWTVSVLFQARDSSNNRQPITTGQFLTLNPSFPSTLGTMVLFGTGQFLGSPDLTNVNVQSLYGVFDNQAATTVTRATMVQQTFSITTDGYGYDTSVACAVSGTCTGWYIDLKNPTGATGVVSLTGYRSLFTPISDGSNTGSVIFEIYQPGSNCSPLGTSFGLDISYINGGAPSQTHLDTNGDGTINSGDTGTPPVSGQSANPVGITPQVSPTSGAPTTTGGLTRGLVGPPVVVCNDSGCYLEYPDGRMEKISGSGHGRTAWWEVH